MSFTLENLKLAEAALDRGDYAEAKRCIKYLRQRMESLLEQRKHWTGMAKGEDHVDHRSTETGT